MGERLEELGDDVVGHFVHQARTDGETWSAIGESMGVTKQAAQKRFVVAVADRDDGLLSRFTPRPTRPVRGTGRRPAWRRRRGRDRAPGAGAGRGSRRARSSGARRHGRERRAVGAAVAEVVATRPVRPPRSQVRFAAESRACRVRWRKPCNCSTTTSGRSTCSWPSSLSPRPTAPARGPRRHPTQVPDPGERDAAADRRRAHRAVAAALSVSRWRLRRRRHRRAAAPGSSGGHRRGPG